MEHERRPAHHHDEAGQDEPTWDVGRISAALDAPPEPTEDLAFGRGVAYRLGPGRTQLELYPEARPNGPVVRVTSEPEALQICLFRQRRGPRLAAEGLIFELPQKPTRLLFVSPRGEAMLHLVPEPSQNISPDTPARHQEATDESSPPETPDALPTPPNTARQASVASQAHPDAAPRTEKPPTARVAGVIGRLAYRVSSQQQKRVAEFVLGEHATDQHGERHPVWHTVVAFDDLAEQVRDTASTGDNAVARGYWHDVPVKQRTGPPKVQRQLYAFAVKVTPKDARGRS